MRGNYPNTTFEPHSELGRAIDFLWDRLLLLGTIVFVLVELRSSSSCSAIAGSDRNRQAAADTRQRCLEIIWTLIPAFILLFIAVPTVRTIFKTQAKVAAGALQIEVIGHQWWWEFRYPEYGIMTANEIYIPTGRTVNFKLNSNDVIHSFWIPQLGGKRDVDHEPHELHLVHARLDAGSVGVERLLYRILRCVAREDAFPCLHGDSRPVCELGSWQQRPGCDSALRQRRRLPARPTARPQPLMGRGRMRRIPRRRSARRRADQVARSRALRAPGYTFPRNQAEFDYAKPHTPIPAGLIHAGSHRQRSARTAGFLVGRLHRLPRDRRQSRRRWECRTEPDALRIARTIGAGSFPNTPAYLALWIKNARKMKPGILMPTLGMNQYDPSSKQVTKQRADSTTSRSLTSSPTFRALK